MKPTDLVLDEKLLETAARLVGAETYSAAGNETLSETIRSSVSCLIASAANY